MYDYPELRAATEAWWAAIARHANVNLPLQHLEDHTAAWHRADLAFSQTCGYPFTHQFRGSLGLVGTPHYAVPGCEGFRYSSFVFARKRRAIADYRGCIAAVNTPDSMSGMLALKVFFVDHARNGRFFGKAVQSGGHVNSLALLQSGEADVCAVDAVCVEYARRYRPELIDGLNHIGQTPLVPGLPYVSGKSETSRWQAAVVAATADPALAEVRQTLMIHGFTVTQPSDYDALLVLEAEVESKGGLAPL